MLNVCKLSLMAPVNPDKHVLHLVLKFQLATENMANNYGDNVSATPCT